MTPERNWPELVIVDDRGDHPTSSRASNGNSYAPLQSLKTQLSARTGETLGRRKRADTHHRHCRARVFANPKSVLSTWTNCSRNTTLRSGLRMQAAPWVNSSKSTCARGRLLISGTATACRKGINRGQLLRHVFVSLRRAMHTVLVNVSSTPTSGAWAR